MSFLAAIPIVGKVLEGVFGIVDKAVLDKDQAAQLKATIQMQMLNRDHTEITELLKAQSSIILAEANGKSWLQRNWRPMLMMVIIAIIANNFVIFPYLSMFTDKTVILDLPEPLYKLMFIGVGGYIGGRTAEKVLTKFKPKE